MKTHRIALVLAAATIVAALTACSKKEAKVDATKSLQQSFQQAEPEVKQAVQAATDSLKAGDYAQAIRTLEPIVASRPLTSPQRQAVGLALQQVNQAVATDPNLNTAQMYQLRQKMFNAVYNGPQR